MPTTDTDRAVPEGTASTPAATADTPADQSSDDSREQRVRDAAYRRYEARIRQGNADGDAARDWEEAETEIDGQSATREA